MAATKAVLILVSASVVLTALSAGLYFYYLTHSHARFDLRLEGDHPVQYDPELGFVATPDASTRFSSSAAGFDFWGHTDALGARADSAGQAAPRRAELLALGGSFAWGYGIANRTTFTSLLGRRLRMAAVNLAMGSQGTVQALQQLQRHRYLRPKIVLYAFIGDHLRRNVTPCASSVLPFCSSASHVAFGADGTPHLRPPLGDYLNRQRAFYRQAVVGFSLRQALAWGAEIALHRARLAPALWAVDDGPQARAASMRWLLGVMGDTAAAMGARLVVVHIPYLHRGAVTPAPAALTAALRERMVFVDLYAAVEAYYADAAAPTLEFPNDGHPNLRGHAFIAEEIERGLREARLLGDAGQAERPQ